MGNVENALKLFFKSERITQQQVADRFNVTQSYVQQLLSGRAKFGKNVARQWADKFGFSYTFLLTGEGELFDKQENETDIMDAVSQDMAAGDDPTSVAFWKKRCEELQEENTLLRGQVEGMRMAMAAMHTPEQPTLKASVG